MKKLPAILAAVFIVAGLGAAQGLDFQAPSLENPAYLVKAPLEIEGQSFRLTGVDFPKGSAFSDFLVFRGGKPADLTKDLGPGAYEIVLRYAWKSGAFYLLILRGIENGSAQPRAYEWSGTAPASGGIPASAHEGFSAVFIVSEESGIERAGEVVSLTVTAPKTEIEGAGLAVFDGDAHLLHQEIETKESVPPESQAKTHPATLTRKLVAAVDSAARGRKLLRVFKTSSIPAESAAFELSGTGLGKSVKGADFALQFHPQSGQILTIEDFGAAVKLTNKAGVIHWNPDVFIPGIAWDHSFDWNPPSVFEEKTGPLVYLNARSGPMPRIRDVFLEVKYTLEKGARHFLAETRMRVDKDLGVIALRNDEMVLFKELFDTIVYRETGGRLVQAPLREIAGKPFGLAHVTFSDLAWVGLLNAAQGYGFFCLRLVDSASQLNAGGGLSHRAGTYYYAPSDGDYVYWVRPYLYTWGEFATSNLLTALPKGSVFYEKNAYLVSRWDPSTATALDALRNRLANPLKVF